MSKVKYYYDSETLSYKKLERKKGRRLGFTLMGIVASFLAGFLLLIIYLNIPAIETPKEKALKRELGNMQLQYGILNKKMERAQEVLANVEDRDDNIYRLYFEANPVPEEQRMAGFGGINRYKNLEGYNNSNLIVETSKKLDMLTKRIVVQSRSLDEIIALAKEKEELLASIPAIMPVRAEDLRRMASGYGWRTDPFTKVKKFHNGMDFSAPKGTAVYATGNGTVVRADNRSSGYGNHIRIDHGFGYNTLYGHLYKYNVHAGQKVKRGDLIGFVGSTGRSQGTHVHYEIFKDGERINPLNFYYGHLSPSEFDEIVQQAQQENQSLD